jgi:hypothetical protein
MEDACMNAGTRLIVCIGLLTLPAYLSASTILRCEDAAGNVMFTSAGCPGGHAVQKQDAYNAPPGGSSALLPPADSTARPSRKPAHEAAGKNIVIVGQRDDGCGNRLSAEQRRRAIINQQTPPGMTRRDVESLLGRPDKVTSRNGETKFTYNEKKGRSSQITFDGNDCVKGR